MYTILLKIDKNHLYSQQKIHLDETSDAIFCHPGIYSNVILPSRIKTPCYFCTLDKTSHAFFAALYATLDKLFHVIIVTSDNASYAISATMDKLSHVIIVNFGKTSYAISATLDKHLMPCLPP